MSIESELRYTEEHEWVSCKDEIATIGITSYAVEELGEIVYVDLPNIGDEFEQMSEFGTVESVKTLSSLYIPLTGEVCEVNTKLVNNPALLNESPYKEAWLVKIKVSDEKELDDLLTYEEYTAHLESL